MVKTEFHESGKDAGKPRYVDTIRTKDVTIYRYPPGGPAPSFVARGPGTMETCAAGGDEVERFVSWRDELQVVPILGTEMRKVTLLGYPRCARRYVRHHLADQKIIADLTPKQRAGEDSALVTTADGRPVKPVDVPQKRSGEAMRLKHVQAFGNVRLVTVEVAADPKASPPRPAAPRREAAARQEFDATFVEAPWS